MKVFFEGYPFAARSGQVISETATQRVERYWRRADKSGEYFEVSIDLEAGKEVGFSISDIKQ